MKGITKMKKFTKSISGRVFLAASATAVLATTLVGCKGVSAGANW